MKTDYFWRGLKTKMAVGTSAATSLLAGLTLVSSAEAANGSFNFDTVRYRAQVLAEKPYVEPASRVPEWLLKLTYDEHRHIRFDPGHT
ncbi:MAG TPA: glucan biosynthesis protein, partial [Opitutus sp.]|nr:glucan biosynthesis protein [Opitutus sp.]